MKRFDESTCLYPRDDYQNGNFESIQLEQADTHDLKIRLTANDEDSLSLEFMNHAIHESDGMPTTKGDMDAF
ncbi:MAG: hypothetical protein HWE34_11955 [Methylocystaceae bacterium]|nr:hypothetical protein [Methylocystaceae bacterium]